MCGRDRRHTRKNLFRIGGVGVAVMSCDGSTATLRLDRFMASLESWLNKARIPGGNLMQTNEAANKRRYVANVASMVKKWRETLEQNVGKLDWPNFDESVSVWH